MEQTSTREDCYKALRLGEGYVVSQSQTVYQ